HVWLLHSIEKLPCISGEAFDVAALAFGIKSVEGQRGFPRTTQTGNNDQLFPRNFHVKVLEIVLAGTANFDNLRRHSDQKRRTYQSSITIVFLQRNRFRSEAAMAHQKRIFPTVGGMGRGWSDQL